MVQNNGVPPQGKPVGYGIFLLTKKRRTRFIGSCCGNSAYTGCGTGNSAHMGIFKRMAGRSLGADNRTGRRNFIKEIIGNTSGDAVVEATILFPIMIMIFAGLVLLSIYLPAQAVLQRATQYASVAIATEQSDTWLFYNEGAMAYFHKTNREQLENVYVAFFKTDNSELQEKAEIIVTNIENRSISSKAGELEVTADVNNSILFNEVVITATRTYTIPVDLSFIGFPDTISVTATSSAIIQDAEEFVRSIDIASGFFDFIIDRYNLHDIKDAISSFGNKVTGILGW